MNNYNANMYLAPTNLNDIEDMIEDITQDVQDNIFEGMNSPLENIQVGDNLSGKTLYLSFPRNTYDYITNTTEITIITTDNMNEISYMYNDNYDIRYVCMKYNNHKYYIYYKHDFILNPATNVARQKLPNDFGTVTSINSSSPLYQYIGVYENENIIPDYVKHVYHDNDVITMRQIDNLENGIKNIGDYYYRPSGFIGNREWLITAELGKASKQGINTQNISYLDLNRWLTNLSLINFDNLEQMTFWNSEVSEIDWQYDNETEWEEL